MTTPQPLPQDRTDQAIATIRGELARADGKASLLLALTGASLAGAVSAAASIQPPTAAIVIGSLGLAALLTATVLLLLAVRPGLDGPGWPRWPDMDTDQLHLALAAGQQAAEAQNLSALARRKMHLIRHAVHATLAGLGFLTLAGILAAAL